MLKKLLFHFLLLVSATSISLTSNAQQIVSTVSSSTYTSCDGSATLVDPTIDTAGTVWIGYTGILKMGGNSISNLCPGSYLLAYISNADTLIRSFSVGSLAPNPCPNFTFSTTVQTPMPDYGKLGSISFNVSGGIAPYTYWISFNSPDTTSSNSLVKHHIYPSIYICRVNSYDGCYADTVLVIPTCAISTKRSSLPPSGSLTCDGSASISILSGGTPPYSYEWWINGNGPSTQNQQIITNLLCPMTQYCMITDAVGCIKHDSVYVSNYADTVNIVNTTFPYDSLTGNLGNSVIVDCSINFSLIASAEIGGFSYQNNTIYITWNLYGITGALIDTVIVPYSFQSLSGGIYTASLTIDCFQKSFDIKHFKAVDQLKLPPASLGISEQQLDEFSVINPFDSKLKLTFKAPTSGTVSLYTLQGGLVHQDSFSTCNALTVATERLASGTYFLHVNNGKETLIRKVIK